MLYKEEHRLLSGLDRRLAYISLGHGPPPAAPHPATISSIRADPDIESPKACLDISGDGLFGDNRGKRS